MRWGDYQKALKDYHNHTVMKKDGVFYPKQKHLSVELYTKVHVQASHHKELKLMQRIHPLATEQKCPICHM